jgi:GNAT superfamily N-acetyltransferase
LDVCWIEDGDKPALQKRMEAADRQTANLRLMAQSRFAVARIQGEIVGWAGIDIHHYGGRFAELFSLYTYPEIRQQGVGAELELIRYRYAMENGFKVAYLRAGDAPSRLNDNRIGTKAFSFVEDLDQDFVGFCKRCEYYGIRCMNPKILKVELGLRYDQLLSQLQQAV